MKIIEFPPDAAFVVRFLNAGRSAGEFYEDQLPIHLAKVDRLPRGVSALITAADLQARRVVRNRSQAQPDLLQLTAFPDSRDHALTRIDSRDCRSL